jgi:hypothetical protein
MVIWVTSLIKYCNPPRKSEARSSETQSKGNFVQQIVHELGIYSYHMQAVHHFQAPNIVQRSVFCGCFLANVFENDNFKYSTSYSDDCHVMLLEYINKQHDSWVVDSQISLLSTPIAMKNYSNQHCKSLHLTIYFNFIMNMIHMRQLIGTCIYSKLMCPFFMVFSGFVLLEICRCWNSFCSKMTQYHTLPDKYCRLSNTFCSAALKRAWLPFCLHSIWPHIHWCILMENIQGRHILELCSCDIQLNENIHKVLREVKHSPPSYCP